MGSTAAAADVVDIPRSQCSLPGAMPEAKPAPPLPPAASAGALEPFDEDAARPVPPIDRQDGATLAASRGRDASPARDRTAAPGIASRRSRRSASTCSRRHARSSTPSTRTTASALREELGDLLLQVVFQAELARAEGGFAIDDVIEGIVDKLVNRHPHVFGDARSRRTRTRSCATGRRSRPRRRVAADCSRACPAACPRSRARSASARRSRASASTGRTREARAKR